MIFNFLKIPTWLMFSRKWIQVNILTCKCSFFLRTFFQISTKGESSLFLKIVYLEVRHEKKSKEIIRYRVYQSLLRRSENYENHDEMEMCIKIANSSKNLFPLLLFLILKFLLNLFELYHSKINFKKLKCKSEINLLNSMNLTVSCQLYRIQILESEIFTLHKF